MVSLILVPSLKGYPIVGLEKNMKPVRHPKMPNSHATYKVTTGEQVRSAHFRVA